MMPPELQRGDTGRPAGVAQDTEGSFAIQVSNLWMSYGPRSVLRGLDLQVPWGCFLTVFGPNGSGKTTLIHLLATLLRPTEGSVRIAGVDALRHGAAVRRWLGVVTHQTLLYEDLTAVENLRFYCRLYRVANADARVTTLLGAVGLEAQQHQRVRTLSHGMQKRLTLARALLHDPPILLLDEPETGLDPEAQLRLTALLKGEAAQGRRTVVMTTHNLEQGLALSDQVAILARGRIAYQGATDTLTSAALRGIYQRLTGAEL